MFIIFSYRTKEQLGIELKNNTKINLELTKKRHNIFKNAVELVKLSNVANYVMIGNNCRLILVFKNGQGISFPESNSLKQTIKESN